MNRAQLKAAAKLQIKGHIGILFIIMLAGTFASLIANVIPVVGALASAIVISPAFTLGMAVIFLNLTKNIAPQFDYLLDGLRDFWSAFKVTFFVGLFTALWSLLFVIPGIVKGLSYSMSIFILAENKGMPAREAIDRSRKMMDGHKMELFLLMLSFIGWLLLGYVTFGIALVWVVPYMGTTIANFYQSLKPQTEVVDSVVTEEGPAKIEEEKPVLPGKTEEAAVPAKIIEEEPEAPAKIVDESFTDDDFSGNDFSNISF